MRPNSNGWGPVVLPCPFYQKDAVWKSIASVSQMPEARELVGYLWARGAMKVQMTNDSDEPPKQEDWGHWTWTQLVLGMLFQVLPDVAVAQLSRRAPTCRGSSLMRTSSMRLMKSRAIWRRRSASFAPHVRR